MVENGYYNFLNWFDERAWYPLGRIVGGTVSISLILDDNLCHNSPLLISPGLSGSHGNIWTDTSCLDSSAYTSSHQGYLCISGPYLQWSDCSIYIPSDKRTVERGVGTFRCVFHSNRYAFILHSTFICLSFCCVLHKLY